jgi:hypothetical protein
MSSPYIIQGVFSYWKDKHQPDAQILDLLKGIIIAIVNLAPIMDS